MLFRSIVKALIEKKPRNYIQLLEAYKRLLRLEVDKLRFAPCVPAAWSEFKIHYRFRETVYHITVSRVDAEFTGTQLALDGADLSDGFVTLVDDGQHHEIRVNMAFASESASTH